MFKKYLLSLLILGLLSPASFAQNSKETQRYGLELGIGTNMILPFAHARFSYRLPVFDDRLDLYLDHTFYTASDEGTLFQQVSLLGSKFYLDAQSDVRPWLGAAMGGAFLPAGNAVGNNGQVDITTFQGFVGEVGLGADMMFNDNFGYSPALFVGYPFILRPEINLKVSF